MNKRIVVVGILVMLVLALFAVGSYIADTAPKPTPPPPTATPLPTLVPGIAVTGLGGPLLNDPEIRAILAERWTNKDGEQLAPINPDTRYALLSSSAYATFKSDPKQPSSNFGGIDFVFPGDTFYADGFVSANPHVKILQRSVIFNTKLMMFTWWRHLPAFLKSGYVTKVDNYYLMPVDKAAQLLKLQNEGKTWRQAGIVFDSDNFSDSPIDLNGTAYGSSTGIEQMAWMANCFSNGCKSPADVSQLPIFMPALINYVRTQGSQGAGSLSSFSEFLSNGEGMATFIGYDSAYPTVANENGWKPEFIRCISSDPKDVATGCTSKNRVVGVYLGGGTNASHTYMALTSNGLTLLKRLQDPRIQEIAWKKLGMTTPATFIADAPISWMSTNVQVGDKPASVVYVEFIKALDAEFKK